MCVPLKHMYFYVFHNEIVYIEILRDFRYRMQLHRMFIWSTRYSIRIPKQKIHSFAKHMPNTLTTYIFYILFLQFRWHFSNSKIRSNFNITNPNIRVWREIIDFATNQLLVKMVILICVNMIFLYRKWLFEASDGGVFWDTFMCVSAIRSSTVNKFPRKPDCCGFWNIFLIFAHIYVFFDKFFA